SKSSTQVQDSYNHAQKMRAVMTYAFGRLLGLGSPPWHQSESTGKMVGNPLVSETVATYMTSLRRRKPQETLGRLYEFNNQPAFAEIKEYAAGSRSQPKGPLDWGGSRAHRLLTLAYVLSFLCLLRFNEVLKIQIHDLEWISPTCISIMLPFRKTNQFGGMLTEWLYVSGITEGYLFRKISSGDRVSTEKNAHMTSEFFLEMFRNNLLDIGIDPLPIRHSLVSTRTEFTNLTIVKYLISHVDEPSERREDYMNPNRPPTRKCYTCGRTCYCV
ncbi:hypothetical protein K438DRAFT_1798649, partial [Mycena galopus ATCC 62051]